MAVRFILGRSGTGKTSYCIRAIVDALLKEGDEPAFGGLIFLVPEQATYQAERAILADKRIAGYNRLNVLSFDRLQFLLLGKNTARPGLSRIGRQMIIQRILRENSDKLQVFGASSGRVGLGRRMAETIAELHQYAKEPDDIEQLLERLQKDERNNLTALKFADIGLIFREYLKAIEGEFIDPDVQLSCACRAVGQADFVKGAKLWVDGFSSFTASELAMLAELLKASSDAKIALCLDPSNINLKDPAAEKLEPVSLFSPTERTYVALVEIIKKCKLQLSEPIILEKAVRFSCSAALAHIERDIFEDSHFAKEAQNGAPEFEPARISAGDNVRIISAPNSRAEVRFVARQILQLVRGKDYRYRDVAVIASDIDRYQHYIRAYFDDYGIPFFIDKKKGLNQHAVVRLICSALEMVTGGFSSSDVFAYLKSDLVPVERCDVDVLENYCVAFGISGEDWQGDREWDFAGGGSEEFEERRVNQIRLRAVVPLLRLRDKLCPAGNRRRTVSSEEFTRAIFDFLDELEVCGKLSEWIEEARGRQDYVTADEHRQFYDKLVDVFDELVAAFGGQGLSCEDYLSIINSAFSQLALAFIPPALDQVLVGSIERSRHPDLKAVFLIGATQKQFPVPVSTDGILTDEDRMAAESVDFALAATASQALAERQYLAYIAFTRASEYLYVTYPVVDDKGSSVARSEFVAELESLFEDFGEESIAGEKVPLDRIYSEAELADLLSSELGRDSRDLWLGAGDRLGASRDRLGKLLNGICLDEQLSELGSEVLSAINYDNIAKLDKRIAAELFGEQIECSVTELGTFAACPYQYFARYVLELKERREFKLEPLDLGVFYHKVLDGLSKKLKAERKDFATAGEGRLLKLLREAIAELIGEDSFISNFIHRSSYNTFIIGSASEVLEDCVLAICEMVGAGVFRPKWSEISFGKDKELGEYKIGLSGGRELSLKGKIDRVDIANLGGEKIAVVFDYKKRRDVPFSWARFYYGLDMQLPVYMLAVRNASAARYKVQDVAGAFYMPVEAAPAKSAPGGLLKKTESFDYKARGVFNGEFVRQLDRTTSASRESRFFNFYVTKDGEPYGHYGDRGVLKPNDFEEILRFAERKAIDLAEEIMSGTIDVKPYRLNTKSPCSYCRYKALCRFDWQINDYNPLVSERKNEVLEKIGTD